MSFSQMLLAQMLLQWSHHFGGFWDNSYPNLPTDPWSPYLIGGYAPWSSSHPPKNPSLWQLRYKWSQDLPKWFNSYSTVLLVQMSQQQTSFTHSMNKHEILKYCMDLTNILMLLQRIHFSLTTTQANVTCTKYHMY